MSITTITLLNYGDDICLGAADRDNEIAISIIEKARTGYETIKTTYINEEQAREIVRHLNREFDLGLKG
jgi:hypothetical protein